VSDSVIITFALIAAVTGIAYGLYLAMWVFKLDAGNPKMQDIAKAIQEGAAAYLNRQYRTVGVVAAVPRRWPGMWEWLSRCGRMFGRPRLPIRG
jgi:K(+)-stimulated pyrophosphate-energized sodium pump